MVCAVSVAIQAGVHIKVDMPAPAYLHHERHDPLAEVVCVWLWVWFAVTWAFVVLVGFTEALGFEMCDELVFRITDVRLWRDVSARLEAVLGLDTVDDVMIGPARLAPSLVVRSPFDVEEEMLSDSLKLWSLDVVTLSKLVSFKLRIKRSSTVSFR